MRKKKYSKTLKINLEFIQTVFLKKENQIFWIYIIFFLRINFSNIIKSQSIHKNSCEISEREKIQRKKKETLHYKKNNTLTNFYEL